MSTEPADLLKEIAKEALSTGLASDSLANSQGQLLDPIPIQSPAGKPAGWIVPVGMNGKLLGFIQLLSDGIFHRYSRFSRMGNSTTGLPTIKDWLGSTSVHERFQRHAGDNYSVTTPVLSYDQHIDRIAWLVMATSPNGNTSALFMAGDKIWAAPYQKE